MTPKSNHFTTAGQTYHQFKVTKVTDIHELRSHLIELVHLPTGAEVMHIANDDPENTFCLSFQTIPTTSNGVAHILEHTVLCGSEKFPVREPFFAMQRRSLNTFMNALTGADFTCFPASSQVPKDFYNLLDVYIDAVFHPFLKELSFLQEGHRLEFATPDDPTSPLVYKGIVFNEMKGAMSSANARLNEALSHALFPDITYGINSGGEPLIIPQLTYEELKSFYRKFYHPSRCLFYFYGNLPLEGHLDFISEKILSEVTPVPPLPPIPHQPRFNSPRHIVLGYPIAADEEASDNSLIAFGWLTCHILEQEELLALSILQIILLDTDASPLKMALLKSGLCKQVSSYMDDEISEIPFIIILKGCNPDSANKLEEQLKSSLTTLSINGIPLEMVDSAIHQLEFYRSEITGDHAPFGLSLFMRSALLKQHGGNPESGLKIHSLFDSVRRKNIENPNYFPELIKKYLLHNTHFVRITLSPDKNLATKELELEKDALKKIEDALTKQQKQEIVKKAAELAAFQKRQEEENQDVLPKVTLADVPKASRVFELTEHQAGNISVYHHSTFTNDIVYADLSFDLPYIHNEDLPYVRLFATLVGQLGSNGRDYARNLEYIQAHTGGIFATLTLNLQAGDFKRIHPALSIRGKALRRNVEYLFTLMRDIATTTDFTDVHRLREVINKQFVALQSNLTNNALKYAINLSASGIDVPSYISNVWHGIEYFWTIKKLVEQIHSSPNTVVEKLLSLQKILLCNDKPHLIITSDAETYDQINGNSFYGLHELPTTKLAPWKSNYQLHQIQPQGRTIASPVAFSSKVLCTVPYTHPDAPALNVAAYIMDNISLHTVIREEGGAYGGGASSNPMSGNFYFYAYRDPHIAATLNAFDNAVEEIVKGRFDASDIEEAQLEMIQAIDAPVAPGSRGDHAYGWLREGKTLAVRQQFRDRLLSVSKEQIIEAVRKHITPKLDDAIPVVFAGKDLLERENTILSRNGKSPLPLYSV